MDAPTNFRDALRRGPSNLHGELAPVVAENPLRILFVTSAHNSLSQRAYIALTEMGHQVTVQVVDSPEIIEAAVNAHDPDLVVCPMLKQFIPETVWRKYTCLVVHPGPHGDRGPSSLDWAIELGFDEWGVTVLEAVEEADAGDIWETR
jgi:putative two-component system hydrogenase maturation factor HypX/HoxX